MTASPVENILITGAQGMIGSALQQYLSASGYKVFSLDRRSTNAHFHYVESTHRVFLDPTVPLSAVINLAGSNIADGRWTPARKHLLLSSRVELTRALATATAALPVKPSLFLSASAIGYYGQTGSNSVNEFSPPGTDFLAAIATSWEAATAPAELAGINTIHMRLGVVLSKEGGMLKKLLLPFKLGLGGRIGNGEQFLSWISVDDVLAIIAHLLEFNPASGPLNLVAGQAVTNADFSAQLAQTLNRPCILPLPAVIVKIIFGEMADAMLLGSTRVQSVKLDALGIRLKYPALGEALQALLRG